MPLIQTSVIEGGAVYGVPQVSYTVDGDEGKDYGTALAIASLKEATAIEVATSSYADVVRERERKIVALGDVMAYIAEAYAKLPVKNANPNDSVTISNGAWVNSTAKKYGITLVFKENSSNMTRSNLMRGQNDLPTALDTEDNNLQQDMVSLQSLVSKRDNAFSTASSIVEKANGSADSIIQNIM